MVTRKGACLTVSNTWRSVLVCSVVFFFCTMFAFFRTFIA